jgi:hypothetical protein
MIAARRGAQPRQAAPPQQATPAATEARVAPLPADSSAMEAFAKDADYDGSGARRFDNEDLTPAAIERARAAGKADRQARIDSIPERLAGVADRSSGGKIDIRSADPDQPRQRSRQNGQDGMNKGRRRRERDRRRKED